MGTSLIRISVIANRSTRSEIDGNNNFDRDDNNHPDKTNEDHLLETPPASVKYKRSTEFSLARGFLTTAAKIGKFAKLSERRIRDERPVIPSVSDSC